MITLIKNCDFASDAEVRVLVSAFESGRLALIEFRHSAHLAVGLAYLADGTLMEATGRMRDSLQRFLARHHQDGAYHETLTLFWMRLLDHLARDCYAQQSLWERVNAVVRSHGGSWPVAAHYSPGRTGLAEARQGWVAPDLLPLPF